MPKITPERVQASPSERDFGPGLGAGRGSGEAEHSPESIRTIQSRAGPPHQLDSRKVLHRLRERVPFLRAEKRQREVPAVLQHEEAPVEGGVESTRVDLVVGDAVLDDVDPGKRFEDLRELGRNREVECQIRIDLTLMVGRFECGRRCHFDGATVWVPVTMARPASSLPLPRSP